MVEDATFGAPNSDSNSPLSKRRRFAPNSLPQVIPSSTNEDLEYHTFDSPLLLQLCEQSPSPAEIEAQLLQVGMRIRKSVAEGYKNTKKFTPRPFANNLHRLSPETQQALCSGNITSSNELSPYYAGGMHNVGGLAFQPVSTATFCGISLAALSYLSDDMSTAEQKLWSYTTSHKRSFDTESDSDESLEWQPQTPTLHADAGMSLPFDYFGLDMETMSDVSPMTQIGDRLRDGRRVAKPKSRIRQTLQPTSMFNQQPETSPFVQSGHKRMTSCGVEATVMNDFSEATFLQRREDVDMDCS